MGYFDSSIKEREDDLSHFGILGQRKGHRNGPPYPLGRGSHSAAEKRAAKAAGVSVGSDSGKGSIENVKKNSGSSKSTIPKPKKELTPEEKRQQAIDAAMKGDRKKIIKNIDQLSTEELQAANERARIKDDLSRGIQNKPASMKEELAKQEAIRSGDKEQIKLYVDKMTTNELRDALDKVDLTAKLNYVKPEPTIFDRINDTSKKVGDLANAAENGIKAYNIIAKVYNSTHKNGTQWPEIKSQSEKQKEKDKSKEEKVLDKILKQASNDVKTGIKDSKNQKSYEEKADEELERKKTDYKKQKEYEDWIAKQEAKEDRKREKQEDKENRKRDDDTDRSTNRERRTTYERYYDDDPRGTTSESPSYWWDDLSPDEEEIYRRYLLGG